MSSLTIPHFFFIIFIILIGCDEESETQANSLIKPLDSTLSEIFPQLGHDAPYLSGNIYYGREGYVEYHPGNIPVILSAPHGGSIAPDEIPDRSYGTMVTDDNTYQLTKVLMDTMRVHFGGIPHVILCKLKRRKLDANRDSVEAAQGNRFALRAWQEYHHYIEFAKNKIESNHGSGLFFDIHGHGRNPDGFYDLRTWLGYLLSGPSLDNSDQVIASRSLETETSIKSLIDSSSFSFVEILRGKVSFGYLLDSLGYKSIPSKNDPGPKGMRYFSGGYNTLRHGSKKSGIISAIQIEAPKPGIRQNQETWSSFSTAMTTAVKIYYLTHFGRHIKS